MSSGSARSTRSTGRRGGDPVRRPRRRRAVGGAAVARRRAVVDFSPVAAGAGNAGRATISRRCGSDGRPRKTRWRRSSDRDTTLFRRLWEPLVVAALNTSAEQASALLFSRILAETIGRGADACRPMLPRDGLSESLVDPALEYLTRHGGEIRFGSRLKALGLAAGRVAELQFDCGSVPVLPDEDVVLAVPATIAARIVPGLVVPDDYAPIVNAHFRYDAPATSPPFLGIVGGTAEWVFRKRHILSVTVSAADRIVGLPADELRDVLWREVARALALPPAPTPPARIVKERRATFRATPAQLARRPPAATAWNNLHLAGDYVDTGLPATIEGAIRSGIVAAGRITRGCNSELAPAGLSPPAPSLPTNAQECQRALP